MRGIEEAYGLAQRKALIRYYFNEVPKSNDDFARAWNELFFSLQFDGKIKVKEIKKG